VGQLFRLGKGERTGEDQALPEMCKQVEEQDAPSQRRRPNRSKMRKIQASSRLISSTVAFQSSAGFSFLKACAQA